MGEWWLGWCRGRGVNDDDGDEQGWREEPTRRTTQAGGPLGLRASKLADAELRRTQAHPCPRDGRRLGRWAVVRGEEGEEVGERMGGSVPRLASRSDANSFWFEFPTAG